jgi:argininosuccinate lyase
MAGKLPEAAFRKCLQLLSSERLMDSGSDYHGYRNSTGSRLTEPMLDHLRIAKSAVEPDEISAVHAFDIAHAIMLTETGIVSPNVGATILRGLQDIERAGLVETRTAAGGGIHSGETYLIQKFGDEFGGRLHLGRSSGDLHAVAHRINFRDQVHRLLGALCQARAALLDLAAGHLSTIMPGYTHGQHAQPTTFAHWATMFEELFRRDAERLFSFHTRLNKSPAGAAIMTGSDFPIDRARVSALLGFDCPLENTMDAILNHDTEMEYSSILVVLAQGLGRLANDLQLWSTFEFGLIELPDRYCGTSSIMPQKKNPDGLEDIKSIAVQSLAAFVTTIVTDCGSTGQAIFEHRHSFALQSEFGRNLAGRLQSLAPLLRDMTVNVKRMHTLAGANWAQATDLASALVHHTGLSWRISHLVVGAFIRRCVESKIVPDSATTELLDQAATAIGLEAPRLSAKAFAEAMDPFAFVAKRKLLGGPAPEMVERAIAVARKRLKEDEAATSRLVSQVGTAELERSNAAQRIIERHSRNPGQ